MYDALVMFLEIFCGRVNGSTCKDLHVVGCDRFARATCRSSTIGVGGA